MEFLKEYWKELLGVVSLILTVTFGVFMGINSRLTKAIRELPTAEKRAEAAVREKNYTIAFVISLVLLITCSGKFGPGAFLFQSKVSR